MKIIAHRGIKAKFPENTLLSFKKALELPVYGLEFDVHAVDDEVICIHDETLERTTNGQGSIYEKKISELRELDAGQGEKIPFLKEILDLAAGKTNLDIEIKGLGSGLATLSILKPYLDSGALRTENFWLSSFSYGEILAVRGRDLRLRVSLLVEKDDLEAIHLAKKVDAFSIGISREVVSHQFVGACHEAGLEVFVFTINTKEELDRMSHMGVDAVFSDDPAIFL